MANSIFDLIQETGGSQPPLQAPQGAAPKSQSIFDVIQGGQTDLAPVINNALDKDPDKENRIRQLSEMTGAPKDAIAFDPEAFERSLAADKMNGLLKTSPVTRELMTDPDNAAIAHDDVENLTKLEKGWTGGVFRGPMPGQKHTGEDKIGGVVYDVLRSLGASALYIPYGLEAAGTAVSRAVGVDTGQPVAFGQTSAERMQGWRNMIDATLGDQKHLMPEVTGAIVSTGQTLAALLAKDPALVLGGVVGGIEAEKATAQGASPFKSALYGLEQGAVEKLTEMFPIEHLIKSLKNGSPFFNTLVKQLALENVTEQVATAWQDLNEWLTLHPEKDAGDYLAERPNAALETLITTTISTGLTTATSHAVVNAVRDDTARADAAIKRANYLDYLKKTYDLSLLRERAPELFIQHQDRALKKAGIETVYIDSDAFSTYGWKTDPEQGPIALAKQFGLDQQKVEDAILHGTDISLTREQFVRNVMMSEDYADLSPHVRFDPDAWTKALAEEYKKKGIKEEVERAMAAKAPVEGADIVVYHGTPYDFLEFSRQDTEGTGEGSASFGSGVYVAEARGVSEYYKNLANNQLNLNDLPQALKDIYGPQLDAMNKRQQDIYASADFADPEGKAALRSYTQDMIKLTDEIRSKLPGGNVFESKLRVKQNELLDLDATYDAQPADIKNLINKFIDDPAAEPGDAGLVNLTGHDFYNALSYRLGGDQQASQWLLKNGVQGNRFLDANSRNRGYGTSNYVIFDPSRLTITKKNDVEIEEVIALAEAELGLQGLFTSAAEAGFKTNKEFEAYLRKVEDARLESVKRQKDKVIKQQLREKDAEWKEEWAKVEAQVREELGGQQVYQALNNIGRDRLDHQAIRATFHELVENKKATKEDINAFLEMLPEDEKGRKIYTPSNIKGIDPQVWAETHGYDSAVDMLQDMMTQPDFGTAVRDATQKIMDAKFGSLKDARLALIEARESLHNEDKLDMLTLELNALQEAKNDRRFKASLLRRAARERMGEMQVQEIAPNKFLAAEKREGRKAGMALRRGVYDKTTKKWSGSNRYEAAQAKLRQVLNFIMAKEAYAAQKRVARDLKYLNKFLNRRKKFPNLPADSLDVIREILADYRVGPKLTAKKKRDLTKWAETVGVATGTPIQIPAKIAAEDSQKNYKEMKLDEFNEVVETIRQIEHAGKSEGQFADAFRKQNVATTVGKLIELVKKHLPQRKMDKRESRLNKEAGFGSYLEAISNGDTMLHHIDGSSGLIIQGEAYQALKRPYDRAISEGYLPGQRGFTARDRDNAVALKEIFNTFTQKERAHMDDKLLIPGVRGSMSRGGYLSIMLNSGTKEGISALIDSGQVTAAEIRAIHNYASEKDWEFAKKVWGYLKTFKDEIVETERRRRGYTPEMVEGVPINTPYGTVEGGYYPLRYDANLADLQSQNELQTLMDQARLGTFVSSMTRRGYTVARQGSGGRPVLLDLGVLFSHTHSMLYDLEVGDAVNDVFKVLYNPAFKQAMIDQGQKHKLDELQLWFGDLVTGEIHFNNMADRWARHLKSGFTISKLGLNIANAFVQPVGLVNTAQLAGKYNTLKAVLTTLGRVHRQNGTIAKWFGQESIYKEILNKSGLMRSRDITFNLDINNAFETMSTTWLAKHTPEQVREVAKVATFYFTKKSQMFTDVVAWQAGYNQAKRKGLSEAQAIENGDRTVVRSQSSSIFGERTRFERGTWSKNHRQSEIVKSFTAMAAFFIAQTNVSIQRTRELKSVKHAVTHPAKLANYLVDQAMVYVIGAALSGWYYWPDDPEEDEKSTAKWLVGATLANFANGLPFVREAASAVQGFDTGGVFGAVAGAVGKTGYQGWQLLWEGPDAVNKTALSKNIINLIGVFGHLPTNQISKTLGAVDKASQGEETGAEEYIFGAKR